MISFSAVSFSPSLRGCLVLGYLTFSASFLVTSDGAAETSTSGAGTTFFSSEGVSAATASFVSSFLTSVG
jgi:hypothetical protein